MCVQFKDEHDLPTVMELIDKSLSEPYSVFTYRYFLQQWPNLCYLAFDGSKAIGVIVCKMDDHRGNLRGYIAMLVVDNTYRGKGLGEQTAVPGVPLQAYSGMAQTDMRHSRIASSCAPRVVSGLSESFNSTGKLQIAPQVFLLRQQPVSPQCNPPAHVQPAQRSTTSPEHRIPMQTFELALPLLHQLFLVMQVVRWRAWLSRRWLLVRLRRLSWRQRSATQEHWHSTGAWASSGTNTCTGAPGVRPLAAANHCEHSGRC